MDDGTESSSLREEGPEGGSRRSKEVDGLKFPWAVDRLAGDPGGNSWGVNERKVGVEGCLCPSGTSAKGFCRLEFSLIRGVIRPGNSAVILVQKDNHQCHP